MKKLLTILLFLIAPIAMFGQKTWDNDSIVVTDIVGSDTMIFVRFYSYGDWAITFDYSDFNADDATLSLGHSQDGTGFDKFDDARLPYLLDVTTEGYTDNEGDTRATVTLMDDAYRTIYLGILLTLNSVTDGTLYYKITKE